jgi:hypothetical protein
MAVMKVKMMIKKVIEYFQKHKIISILLITIFTLYFFQIIAEQTGLMDKIRPALPVDISKVKWNSLKSDYGQYSIKYPDSWKVEDNYPSIDFVPPIVTYLNAPYDDLYLFVLAQTSDEKLHFVTLENWVDIQKPYLQNLQNIELLFSRQEYRTKKYSGSMTEYLYPRLFSGKRHCIEWYVYHINRGYTFRFCVNDDKWQQAYPLMQAMLESVELTNQ